MPTWSNCPPAEAQGVALPIKRTPQHATLRAVATSDDLIGCYTHFYGGHTVPCESPECEACQKGLPFRWHGYFGALDVKTRLHFIFEMTAQAAETFVAYRAAHASLRGCLFTAERMHHRANGRVLLTTATAPMEQMRLPKAPDLLACMTIIWQLPTTNVATEGQLKGVDRIIPIHEGSTITPDGNGRPAT